jgi:hypothetical protein
MKPRGENVEYDKLALRLAHLERRYMDLGETAVKQKDRLAQFEAALTPEQCRRIVVELESREWSGLTHDDIRMIAGSINDARSPPETPVSTLCAVCDQIKELHPNTHPWTAKETKGDAG